MSVDSTTVYLRNDYVGNEQSAIRALTSVAAAPMIAKAMDSAYSVPEGHLQGVTDLVEHAGRAAPSAAGAWRARVLRGAESFIVSGAGVEGDDGVVSVEGIVYQGAWKREEMESMASLTLWPYPI